MLPQWERRKGVLCLGHTAWSRLFSKPVITACLILWVISLGLTASCRGPVTPQTASASTTQPDVELFYFGEDLLNPSNSGDVVLMCVVCNRGDSPVPANSLQLRCLALSGLDYTSGDITPLLPALAPHQFVVYRWRLAPTGEGPMLAAAILQSAQTPAGCVPAVLQIASTAPPSLQAPPHFGAPLPTQKAPAAGVDQRGAWIGANRVGLRLVRTQDGRPLLLLTTRNGSEWQMAGIVWPLFRVCSAEDAIKPWWHAFYWEDTRVQSTKTSATLTLIGSVGRLWRAEMSFTVQPNTTAVACALRLVARADLRVHALQLPRLFIPNTFSPPPANGTPLVLTQDDPSPLGQTPLIAAYHYGFVTSGIVASVAPLANLQWECHQGSAADVSIIAPEWKANGDDPLVLAKASLVVNFRLFTLAPSLTISDALRFQTP
ncbi:hypothetical protein CWRG_01986 [Chthonomonas calidirosea]|uniref:hypothetical protein n=1 Tax=Chthonomonas calidirosea TaxID=454171 RepID=UPI0006DD4D32|nr:hypothetical protein [Chthonomonas calidirosea]CEK17892.1 hypothetical protein CWRG_01986 [Chthonomonas calidirosea]